MQIQDALGDWFSRPGPLYARIAAAIREAIDRADIPPGSVLPPERALAKRLAIGRGTVVAAYTRLREDGLVDSRQGSGTWVRGAARHNSDEGPPEALRMAALRDATALVDLATAALPAHARMRHLLGALASAQTATVLDTPGYLPSGLPALRQAVATRLAARGLATDPDQVLVTTGDQQALSLLCAHALHPGDTAVVESPTSPGILDVLYSMPVAVFGARPVAVESADLIREVDRREARLAYLMPTLGPSGRILQHAARAQLARALAGRSTLIVDDTSQAELSFGPVPAPLAAFTDAPNLITTGSLTKLHWGGLRLGWIRGPAPLIAALTRAKARADLGTPVLDQILAVQLLQEEDDIRADRITELRACLAHATSMLRRHLPELTFEPPAGGLSMWLRLPEGTATAFAEVATRLGVAVVPGALLSHQGSADDHIRLVYTRPPEVFDEGVHRLAVAWHHYRRTTMSTVAALSPAPVLLT